MLKEFFERRRVKQVFSKLADPKVVEALIDELAQDSPESMAPRTGQIEFVVCYPRDDQPGRQRDFMGWVVDIGNKFEAQVDIASGAYVCLWFKPGSASERLNLVDQLRRQMGDGLKLVHGSEQGSWGVFTNSKLAHFGFAIPGFDTVLGQLASLRYGEAKLFQR